MTPEWIAKADLYRWARCAVTFRETFGKLPNIDHLPEWVRDNLDELTLLTLRAQLIDVLRETGPTHPWELDDDSPPAGDWLNISAEPEKFVEWIDEQAREEMNGIATAARINLLKARIATLEQKLAAQDELESRIATLHQKLTEEVLREMFNRTTNTEEEQPS